MKTMSAFECRGHALEGKTDVGGVSAAGDAIPSNARWTLIIDRHIHIDGGREAQVNETEDEVRESLKTSFDQWLAHE